MYSTNITSDKETGIGKYSYEEFFDAMHHGVGVNGNLYPAMPYTSYSLLTDDDTKAKAASTAMMFSRTNTLLSLPMLYAMVSANLG